MKEKELTSLVEGQNCFVYARFERDMIWLSPVLAGADNVYIELAEMAEKTDYTRPELDSECLVLIAADGFMTEEQRLEMEENGSYSVETGRKPENSITLNEYLQEISTHTGHNYELIGEFDTNIGMLKLYRSTFL